MQRLVFLFVVVSTIAIANGGILKRDVSDPVNLIPEIHQESPAPETHHENPVPEMHHENPAPAEVNKENPATPEQEKEEEIIGSEVKVENAGSETVEPVVDGEKGNSSDGDLKSRMGLTFNRAQSSAYGPYGYGGSQAGSYGMKMGIIGPGGYTPLINQNYGYGNSYSMGRAPMTYAGTRFGGGMGMGGMGMGMRGNGYAGYYGGRGNAMTNSMTMQQAIPIGYGTALYSNLKIPNSSKETDTNTSGEVTAPEIKTDPQQVEPEAEKTKEAEEEEEEE